MGHFALTCPYELSNDCKDYEDMDVWGDKAMNSSVHASNTRKSSHDAIVFELDSIARDGGITTISLEKNIPYRDNTSRKRGDLMTTIGGLV